MFELVDAYLATKIVSDPSDGTVIRAENAPLRRIQAETVPCTGEIVVRVEGKTVGIAVVKHRFEVFLQDADGVTANGPSIEMPAGEAKFNLTWHKTTFPDYGDYQVVVRVDGVIVAELPLVVERPGLPASR